MEGGRTMKEGSVGAALMKTEGQQKRRVKFGKKNKVEFVVTKIINDGKME